MSRLRLSAPPIASLSVALLLSVFWNAARTVAAEETASHDAGSSWQAANEFDNPFRAKTTTEWSPVRPQPPATVSSPDSPQRPTTAGEEDHASQTMTSTSTAQHPEPTQPEASTRWQLPNGKIPTNSANRVSQAGWTGDSQALRMFPPAANYEPQPFNPPANAARLSTHAPRTANNPPWNRGDSRSVTTWPPKATAAAPHSSATMVGSGDTNNKNSVALRPTTPGRMAAHPRTTTPMNQQQVRGASSYRRPSAGNRTSNSLPGRSMWDSIVVAFQAPETWTEGGSAEPDSLPLPGGSAAPSKSMVNGGPMMHDAQEMAGPVVDGGYGYDGGPGGSCPCNAPSGCSCPGGCGDCGPTCGNGTCGCEPGCGCGCCAEVGCACEPGCGCPKDGCDLNCCGPGDPAACTTVRIGVPRWQEFTLFGGVQGFKGPYDRLRDSGNFGFNEGFNAGFKLPFTPIGYQIGYRAAQSQLNGDIDTNISDSLNQHFITIGVFQRAKNGLQWGLVWDELRDERSGTHEFQQLRTEISLIESGCHEIGFAGAFHVNDNELPRAVNDGATTIFQASDQYLVFYRLHACAGGEGRFYGGVNDNSDAIVGADMLLPLQDRWSLQAGFTYLIPHENSGRVGAAEEAWNIGLTLVWHWDCRARRSHSNCYRPLFNVADNGYLIVDDRPGRPAPNNN